LPNVNEPYRHCDDAAALIEHLGLGRVVAVGHSVGANQYLELAITRPDLVSAYVAVCAANIAGIPFPPDIVEVFGKTRALETDEAKRVWKACGWFDTTNPDVARAIDEILADYTGWHWKNTNPAKSLEPPAGEQLAKVDVPALVITGARDLPYNTLVGEKLVAGLPNAKALRIEAAGHMAPMDAPAEVAAAITELAS
jgi:pimeloyl-ACP methyl ester carboxylesterase